MFDGFDHYAVGVFLDYVTNTISVGDTFTWRRGGSIRVGPSPMGGSIRAGRFGGGALYPGNVAGAFTYGILTTPINETLIGFATFLRSGWGIGYVLKDYHANEPQITVVFGTVSGNQVIQLYRASTLIYTSGSIFNLDTWFYAEVRTTLDPSDGILVVNIDGVNKVNLTGLNTQGGSHNYWDSLALASISNREPIDDLYLEDNVVGPGPRPFNDFQGPVRVFTKYPIRTVSTQFTPLSSTNISQVDDPQMDSNTTYNYSPKGGVDNTDLFVGTRLPYGSMPLAVRVQSAFKQDDTGIRSMANVMKSGSVTSVGTDSVVNQSYIYHTMGDDMYPYNPDGSVNWTKASVDATNFGYKMTG